MERDAHLLTVREFMNGKVTSLPANIAIDEALRRLDKAGYSGAPVVEDGRVVGVLSEMDCARVMATAAFDAMPVGTVADHMTRDVDTVSPDDDIFGVAQRFLQTGHRRLPVCDATGALVGLVALRDLGHGLQQIFEERAQRSGRDHPPGAAWDVDASRRRDKKS